MKTTVNKRIDTIDSGEEKISELEEIVTETIKMKYNEKRK